MHKLDQTVVQSIQNKFEFLLYNQATTGAQYRHVYANGFGSMYYCCGSADIPTDPTAVLIGDYYKVFCATEFGAPIKGIDRKTILQDIKQKQENCTAETFFFDAVNLNIDGSFVLGRTQNDKAIEFNSRFQRKAVSSFNRARNLSKLPNGMTVQFAWDDLSIRTIEDGPRNEVLSDIESVQRLSGREIVIWQKNRSFNDVYIIDFATTPEYYEVALNHVGQNELNQDLVSSYKSRYMKVAELLLDNKKQK